MNNSAKYFFIRCFELLHPKAFDTYRVSLHNPFTIFWELEKSIEKYHKKRIRNFDPTITSIGEEAKSQIENECLDCVFRFGSFTKKQASIILENTCIKSKDGKKNRTLSLICNTLIYENKDFKNNLIHKLKDLLVEDNNANFEKINTYTSWLISQLLFHGYSRKFIIDRIRKSQAFVEKGNKVEDAFGKFESVFTNEAENYEVIFKYKRNSFEEIRIASQYISKIEAFPIGFANSLYVNEKFKEKGEGEFYLSVQIESYDFWSALRKAYPIVSESIELNVLHDSNNRIFLDKQALVIHSQSKRYRMETTEENLDGFYNYQEQEFYRFVDNFKNLGEDSVAREKIRSAIRFYKLGSDSVEIEHKILNYWIGFEQLFSSVDSDEDSIKRIKSFFISINAVYYWQRRTNYLLSSLKRTGKSMSVVDLIPANNMLFEELNPLMQSRLSAYIIKLNNPSALKAAIEKHTKRLEQHLTRIYRLRNELVHEGKSSVDLFLIAGHLRHYLLFSIEQITNELIDNQPLQNLDDVFVYFENLLTRIKDAKNIQEIFSIKEYKGYME